MEPHPSFRTRVQGVLKGALTRAAIFLVLTINPGSNPETTVKNFCADISGLRRTVGFRDLNGQLSCVLGVGSAAWDRLFPAPRSKELHPFKAIMGVHLAVSTLGELLFHTRVAFLNRFTALGIPRTEATG